MERFAIISVRGHHILRTVVLAKLSSIDFRDVARRVGLMAVVWCMVSAVAQSTNYYSPVILQIPKVDIVDDNHVSMLDGKAHFTVPAVKLGDVAFTPFSFHGNVFWQNQVWDQNYGWIGQCSTVGDTIYGGTYECFVPGQNAVVVIYGQERAVFLYSGSQYYTPQAEDGSSLVDNGSTCTWTKRDGTKIVFVASHSAGNPLCMSYSISHITYPDGRIATYHYGSLPLPNKFYPPLAPILSIVTNTGYMLKYNYSGTPTFGAETSVVALNRAFESCDPFAVSCTLANSWPTATLSWQSKSMTPRCDNYAASESCNHYIFTIQDAAHRNYVFELDSIYRVVSYQPPDATSPIYDYSLCELLSGNTTYAYPLSSCWTYTHYDPALDNFYYRAPALLYDMVQTVTRNGQYWMYNVKVNPGSSPPAYSTWGHSVTNPLGRSMGATGNATPYMESYYGPTDSLYLYDGSSVHYERSVRNALSYTVSPDGLYKHYAYDSRSNLISITQTPKANSGLSTIVQSATYPSTCDYIVSCNKPTAVLDANGNETDYTYDAVHGGVLTETYPSANGIRSQIRRTYVQRYAWYLNATGTMTRDANPVWLLATESYCRTGAASGSGCALANDEVLTSYDYGPDSGPNNLILRGKTVTADGQTVRTCYAHDKQGNKIWETAPNAHPSSCTNY